MNKLNLLFSIFFVVIVLVSEVFCQVSAFPKEDLNSANVGLPYQKCWEIADSSITSFASDNSFTILSNNDGDILLYERVNNEKLWKLQIGNKLNSELFFLSNSVLIISYPKEYKINEKSSIRLVDKNTGVTVWINEYNKSSKIEVLDIGRDKLTVTIFNNYENINIQLIEISGGKTIWEKKIDSGIKLLAYSEDSIYFLNPENNILQTKVSSNEGKILARQSKPRITAIQTLVNELIIGDATGRVYIFDATKKTEKKLLRSGGEISSITKIGNNLVIASNDNFLYYYSTNKGKIIWKRRLAGRVSLPPVISSGKIFVYTMVEPFIQIINQNDGNKINQIHIDKEDAIIDFKIYQDSVFILSNTGLSQYESSCE